MLRLPSSCYYYALNAFSHLLIVAAILNIPSAYSGYSFDTSFLEIGGGNSSSAVKQQVSAMSDGQLPGIYRVEILVNDRLIEKRDLRFIRASSEQEKSNTGLFPCLDIDFFRAQGVSENLLKDRNDADISCIKFSGILSDLNYDYDFNRQILSIEIPQAFIGSIPFELRRKQWNSGETVAFANYSLSSSVSESDSPRRQDQFGSLRNGFNVGAWRLRNFSTWQNGSNSSGQWESVETYAQRDLGNIMAVSTLGDATTEGDLFDSIPYRGLSIVSDLDMLPDQAREFAPVIRGIANGRSRVTIRQRGYVIYEQWVPSGPFALTDLYPTASNGDLEVTVEGSDGKRQVYTQSFSAVPYMLREGQHSYSVFIGQYRPAKLSYVQEEPAFIQASLRRGFKGGTTFYGGSLNSERYNAGLVGIAQDIAGLGAISVDVTHARSDDMGRDKTTSGGQSFRFRYSKSLAATDTNLSLIGYRYSTEGYYSFDEALNSRNVDQTLDTYRGGHTKSNFTANLSQQLGGYGGIYANISKTSYWGRGKADTSVQLGYNSSLGDISYSLGLGVIKGPDTDERNLSVRLSMPLGDSRRQRVTAGMSQSARGLAFRTATLSGNALEDDTLAYSVGVLQQTGGMQNQIGGNAAVQYDAPAAILRGAYNATIQTKQLDAGIEGSVVAYGSNVIFSQPLGETNIIVATPGASGVAITNKRGVRTNSSGYTIVPQALPYRKNRVALDTQSIPSNVDISEPVSEVTPTRGAFVLADFDTRRGKRVLFRISDINGENAPFAARAELYSSDNRVLGSTLVADNGRVYLTGVPDEARLLVTVNGKIWCSRDIKLDNNESQQAAITQLNIHCERFDNHTAPEN